MGGWSLDKKIISIYMGNPDNSNHAELELPATPWELVDAMDRLRLSEGQEPYWQVEDMGRYEFLAPHLDGYDLYQFNALAEKLRTFSGNVKKCAVGKHPKSEKLGSTGQAACCACIHSRYFTGGSPSGLRV